LEVLKTPKKFEILQRLDWILKGWVQLNTNDQRVVPPVVEIDEDVDEDLISMDGIIIDEDVSKIIIQLWQCYLFRIWNF
jgi:hypothetical protein